MRKKGSISLFIAMIFMLMVSVISTSIKSARVQGAKAVVAGSASMALDSIFASYDNSLFSSFGILLYDGRKSEGLPEKIDEYMSYNLDTTKGLMITRGVDLYGICDAETKIEKIVKATDAGGLIWQDMAVDYEKYAKPVNMAAEYLNLSEKKNQGCIVENISDSIVECTKKVLDINEDIRELMELIDGVKCKESGIDFSNVKVKSSFIKQFHTGNFTSEALGITNMDVYEAVEDKTMDVISLIEQLYNAVDDKKSKDEENYAGNLLDEATQNLKLTEKAIKVIDDIYSLKNEINADVSELETEFAQYVTLLDDSVLEGINEEVDILKNYDREISDEICDIDRINDILKSNKSSITKLINEINNIKYCTDKDDKLEHIDVIRESAEEITVDGMIFQYEKFEASEDETGIIDELTAFFEDGVVSLVIPENETISKKNRYDVRQLTSDVIDTEETDDWQEESTVLNTTAKKIIYTEYIMDNFSSFTDKNNEEILNYQVEYILYGNKTDKNNLKSIVTEIAGIRSGINMIYLFTDSEKKQAAYTMAAGLVGFSGIEALVRLTQFAIMYVWSYAEGIADVKTLLSGGKVPITKNKTTWQTSIDNLFAKEINKNTNSQKGLGYEDYLRFLLFAADDGEKAARTMDNVEMYMVSRGDNDFRLYNYMYGMEISTSYSIEGISKKYTQKSVYTY